MEAKWVPESLKIDAWRVVLRVLVASGAPWGQFGEQVVPKRRPKCSQDGARCPQRGQLERTWGPGCWQRGAMMSNLPPKWRYDGQLGAQDGQLGSILGAILAHLGHLGANFNENVEKQKTFKNLTFFYKFLMVWGVHLEPIGGHVGLSRRILATR